MQNLLSNKKLWIVVGGVFILIALFFIFTGDEQQLNGNVSSDKLLDDTFVPIIIIDSPEELSWQNDSFHISVFEEDLDSGINQRECSFETCAYNILGEEFCSPFIRRFCNNITEITVGEDKQCPYEGREACIVFVQAIDLAGNVNEFFRSFNIDLTPPQVSSIFLTSEESGQISTIQAEIGEEYQFSVSVKDDVGVGICGLYVDNLYKSPMLFSSECRDDCVARTSYKFLEPGSHEIYARCSDQVGNITNGEIRIAVINRAPVINVCRVTPTQGDRETEFHFSVDAFDIDNDILTYEWDFGDDTISQGSEVIHRYKDYGTYTPKIIVQDNSGAKDQCSTAWVVVK